MKCNFLLYVYTLPIYVFSSLHAVYIIHRYIYGCKEKCVCIRKTKEKLLLKVHNYHLLGYFIKNVFFFFFFGSCSDASINNLLFLA